MLVALAELILLFNIKIWYQDPNFTVFNTCKNQSISKWVINFQIVRNGLLQATSTDDTGN